MKKINIYQKIINSINIIKLRPHELVEGIIAIIRGTLYILYYKTFKKNVRIKFPLKAYSTLRIIGPGNVFIDKNCSIHLNVFKGLSIVTLSKKANVNIGKQCILGGLTIRCKNSVNIGDKVITAVSLVQDVFIANIIEANKLNNLVSKFNAKEISIGKNVWLGGQCIILGDCTIGDNSVISAGTLCSEVNIHDYHLTGGNPAKRSLPIDKLLKWKE